MKMVCENEQKIIIICWVITNFLRRTLCHVSLQEWMSLFLSQKLDMDKLFYWDMN